VPGYSRIEKVAAENDSDLKRREITEAGMFSFTVVWNKKKEQTCCYPGSLLGFT
jgi:hypothetical protein